MAIYYLAPDNETPSWGLGVIYHHVKALVEEGIESYVLHEKELYQLTWLKMTLPIKYQSSFPAKKLSKKDILIVPEILAVSEYVLQSKARKILFLQAPAYVFSALPANKTHVGLGYEKIMIILPHMIPIVEKFIHLPYVLISPMIAGYFFDNKINDTRKKEIIIYPKFDQIDFSIIRNLILRKIGNHKFRKMLGVDWRLKILQNYTHKEVAGVFKKSSFFISLNLFEALNTSVVEAMASGCIVFCYEGFGPRDYLENEKNAFVFANNEPYLLIEKLYEVIDNYDNMKNKLKEMQENARKTAEIFSYENMKYELISNIKKII